MAGNSIKLTRAELYRRIWETPTTKLAKEFGISDVAVGKICKKLDTPKPPPGYWQRLEFGHKVERTPLAPAGKGVPDEVWIDPHERAAPFSPPAPEVIARIESEARPENRIHVADTLHHPHPLIRQTRQVIEKATPDLYGMVRHRYSGLDIRVLKTTGHRALRIMDALLKALEARDHSIEFAKDGSGSTQVVVRKQKVRIRLSEKVNRTMREMAKEEKKNPPYISELWVYTPSGKLTFEIDEYCSEMGQKKWTDKETIPLEEQLNDIIVGIISTAEALRLREIKWQEEARLRREAELRQVEEERRRREEEERRKYLEAQAEMWVRSRNVRSFLEACECALIEQLGEIMPGSPEAEWLEWARRCADQVDPLKNDFLKALTHQVANSETTYSVS
jgi:hypothetical protein